jgi:hypothetical protein
MTSLTQWVGPETELGSLLFWAANRQPDVNGHLKVPTYGQVKVPTRRSLFLALTSS